MRLVESVAIATDADGMDHFGGSCMTVAFGTKCDDDPFAVDRQCQAQQCEGEYEHCACRAVHCNRNAARAHAQCQADAPP